MTTRDDLIYAGDGCRLTDEQREFVNPVWFSLGRAYLAPEDHDPCLIENERREPIGFLCFTAWADVYSWSYFLDVRQQGRGYGKRAAQLALRLLRLADPDMPVKLAVEAANTRAQRLYRSLGFLRIRPIKAEHDAECHGSAGHCTARVAVEAAAAEACAQAERLIAVQLWLTPLQQIPLRL